MTPQDNYKTGLSALERSKIETVAQAIEMKIGSKRSYEHIGKVLGVHPTTISLWMKKYYRMPNSFVIVVRESKV
jgi:hypothetical protein